MTIKQFIRTGAYALLIRDKQILLARKTGGHIHLWDLPGGGIEFSAPPYKRSIASS